MNNQSKVFFIFIIIFAISGFSGLIYESIWSHYLKLYLGHSSYAQVLVLIIFMGGMAIGSAIASRLSGKMSNLILWYGIAEGIIGICALLFHQVFVAMQSLSYEVIFPALGGGWAVSVVKWGLGSLLILPQSLLLGATFPFLTAGILRRFSVNTGKTLATFYFVNSLGAAIGILCNIFIFIPKIGLPGAVLTAGLINVVLALFVYRLSKHDNYPAQPAQKSESAAEGTGENGSGELSDTLKKTLLAVSLLTGLASFMYEIGWIRMLTLVLGGSTHSFEIMLSAFILGLAIGGFWIRKKIDKFKNPIKALGYIQLLMGTLAVLTLPLYSYTYEFMSFVISSLAPTDGGYFFYKTLSLLISLMVMLPATICAGTTLPLVTYILIKNGKSDASIGHVYALNTVGAIAGICLAILIVMPMIGLKWVIVGGGLVDIVVGLVLLMKLSGKRTIQRFDYAALGIIFVGFFMFSLADLSQKQMASGVFRYGKVETASEVIFHKDGKTSTVAVLERGNQRSILNNGKPDAGMRWEDDDPTTAGDEMTMVMLGTLPFVFDSDPEYIANIGLGSGLTAHTILGSNDVKRLDSIEIEAAVVEASQLFRPNVDRAYADSRSNIIIDDAKTYFAASQNKYDVIVSEPPNPWVSGVSSLFSDEFYQEIQLYLKNDGVLVQWTHVYEMSPLLVATIYQALRRNFNYVYLYKLNPDGSDLGFVASNVSPSINYQRVFQQSGLVEELERVNIKSADDLEAKFVASTAKLDYAFNSLTKNYNSDYFPILDIGAAADRFKKKNGLSIVQLNNTPYLDVVIGHKDKPSPVNHSAIEVVRSFLGLSSESMFYQSAVSDMESDIENMFSSCSINDEKFIKTSVIELFKQISLWGIDNVTKSQQIAFVNGVLSCDELLDDDVRAWFSVLKFWLNENYESSAKEALALVRSSIDTAIVPDLLKIYYASVMKLAPSQREYISSDHLKKKDFEIRVLDSMVAESTTFKQGS